MSALTLTFTVRHCSAGASCSTIANMETRTPDPMLEHRIRVRAYELYEKRLRSTDVDDWVEAEREILAEIEGASRTAAA